MTVAHDFAIRFGEYVLIRTRFDGKLAGTRLNRTIQPDMIGIVVSVDQRGTTSVGLHDLSRPLSGIAEAVDLIIAAIQRPASPSWLTSRHLGGTARQDDHPGVRLLAGYLSSLAGVAEALPLPDGIAAIEAAVVLAAAVYPPEPVVVEETRAETPSARKADAIRLIDKRLMDPGLTPESLARELGVSRATLFRDFGRANGVKAYIRSRRLAMARQALLRRSGGRPSIAEIAHAHGFGSESHFSRAYRLAFGHTPGSSTAKALLTTPASDLSVPPARPVKSAAPRGTRS
jgi:AraC-like DNA-binding protein